MEALGIHALFRDLVEQKLGRRAFVRAATGLGLSAPAITLFLASADNRAAAQDATPPPSAPPCAGDGCLWAGKEIAVQVVDGGIKQPLLEARAEFEAATGATVRVVADWFDSAFDKLIADATGDTPIYDGSLIDMSWLGELVARDLIVPVDPWTTSSAGYPDIRETIDQEPDALKRLRSYDGRQYVVPSDCDGHVLYYRRDLMMAPTHRTAFLGAYGYELPIPPATWDQLHDVAEYFNGKPNGIDDAPLSGIATFVKAGNQGALAYASLSAPYVIGPNNPASYWFDPADMRPLLVSPGHIQALEMTLRLFELGTPLMIEWGPWDAWDYFLKGNAVFVCNYGDVAPLAIQNKEPLVGKIGCAPLPGTMTYTDPITGIETATDAPNLVGNTAGGSWGGAVMKSAADPDLVYYFWAMLATPAKQAFYAARGSDGVDPGRAFQYITPVGTAAEDVYTAQGWSVEDARNYCQAYKDTFENPLQAPFLRIPGAQRYMTAITKRIVDAILQRSTAAESLANLAVDFDAITDDLGRDAQLASYRQSLGL